MCSYFLKMANFSSQCAQERNFLSFEYHNRKDHKNFMPGLLLEFERKCHHANQPALNAIIILFINILNNYHKRTFRF